MIMSFLINLLEETKEKYITESQSPVDEIWVEQSNEKWRFIKCIKCSFFRWVSRINRDPLSEYQNQGYNHSIKDWENQIVEIQMSSGSIDKERGKLELLLEELKEKQKEYYEILSAVEDHDVVVNLLKDSGIKTQIVKKYLPAMNRYIRHYLTELDLPIHFVLDEEFNESVPLHCTRTSLMLLSLRGRRVGLI